MRVYKELSGTGVVTIKEATRFLYHHKPECLESLLKAHGTGRETRDSLVKALRMLKIIPVEAEAEVAIHKDGFQFQYIHRFSEDT